MKKVKRGQGSTVSMHMDIEGLDNSPGGPNRVLSALARLRGVRKEVVVREAIIEYVAKHGPELAGKVELIGKEAMTS
jgi:hypothetical protein